MLKKMKIDNRSYSVTTMNDFTENESLYNPRGTAIENAAGVVLPIRAVTDDKPGIQYDPRYMVCNVNKPSEEELPEYSADNIIDYGKCEDIRDVLETNNLVRNLENEMLTDKDNIFQAPVSGNEEPAMGALKEAINSKQVDIYKYESRFKQFQNDLRLLKGDSITLSKLVSISDNLDIEAEIVLRDKQDCPNPMNKEIRAIVTKQE